MASSDSSRVPPVCAVFYVLNVLVHVLFCKGTLQCGEVIIEETSNSVTGVNVSVFVLLAALSLG